MSFACAENTTIVERYGEITIGQSTYSVTQRAGGCRPSLASTLGDVPAHSGTGSFSITSNSNQCRWSVSVSADAAGWLSIPTAQALVSSTVHYSYLRNPSATSRTGTIIVAGQTYTVRQAGADCGISLSRTAADLPATAAGGHILVETQNPDCIWTPVIGGGKRWLFLVEGEGSRTGTQHIDYYYSENPTFASRTQTITVGGQTCTFTQAGACEYTLLEHKSEIAGAASTAKTRGRFLLTVQGSGCSWTPVSTDNWITNLTKAERADGSWAVSYSYTANNSLLKREGKIMVGDKTHTVTQNAGCSCTPASGETHMGYAASTAEIRGSFLVTIQGTDCTWTPSTTDHWITDITKEKRADSSWKVTFSYTENYSHSERVGRITVGNTTHTVRQEPPCSYTFTPNYAYVGSAASTAATTGSFLVTARGTDCSWTPSATANWITHVTKAANADGSWTVTYSYVANPSNIGRYGRIVLGDKSYYIVQGARCTYTLDETLVYVDGAATTEQKSGSFSVFVQGTDGCSWTPATTDNWITQVTKASTANADGSWTVSYSYTPNLSTTEREGRITVDNRNYRILQSPGCSYTLPSSYAEIGSAASTAATRGSFSVIVQGPGCSWTPSATVNWITHVTKAANADGSWTVTYSYTANTGYERKGHIIFADQAYKVIQAGTANPSGISRTRTISGQTSTVTQSAEKEEKKGSETISGVSIFPNPAKDFVTIDLSESQIKYESLKILNQVGQVLYQVDSPPAQALEIPLNGFTGGLYFILLQGGDKTWVEKLIVQ